MQFAVRGLLLHPAQLGLYFYVTGPSRTKNGHRSCKEKWRSHKKGVEKYRNLHKPGGVLRSPRRHRPGCFYKKNRQKSRFGLKSGEFAFKKSTHQARTAANNSKAGPEISPGIICSQRRFALAAQASSGLLFIKKHANSAVFVPNQSICF